MSARDEAIERALMEAWCNRPDVGISDVRAFDAALSAAGWVVAKVPEDELFDNAMGVYANERRIGRNAALAAVRASAVEVE